MATLDCSNPAPRVNFQDLGQFVGKRVTIVGRIEGIEGNTLQLRLPDDGVVAVQLQNMAPQVRAAAGAPARPGPLVLDVCCSPTAEQGSCGCCRGMHLISCRLASVLSLHFPQASVLEVQGLVNSPNSVTEDSLCPLSDNFGEPAPCTGSVCGVRTHVLSCCMVGAAYGEAPSLALRFTPHPPLGRGTRQPPRDIGAAQHSTHQRSTMLHHAIPAPPLLQTWPTTRSCASWPTARSTAPCSCHDPPLPRRLALLRM